MAGKRKSDASSSAPTKKARKQVSVDASDLVASILDEGENFQLPEDDETILEPMLRLARYARSLEDAAEDLKPKTKSPQEIQAAAGKLRAVAVSGIQKQMSVGVTLVPSFVASCLSLMAVHSGSHHARRARLSGHTTAYAPIQQCSQLCWGSSYPLSSR